MTRTFTFLVISAISILFLLPGIGAGADYQSMSTQELSELRGSMYDSTQEERDAFRAEWARRINLMSPEEKEKYLGPGSGRGKGSRSETGLGDGRGRGKGSGPASLGSNGGSGGSGQGNGQGGGQRNGQGNGQGGGRK